MQERDVEPEVRRSPDEAFTVRVKKLGDLTGGRQLGCSLVEVPPGKRAWPYHYHWANEEALFVLHGQGTLLLDGDAVPIRDGDYVTLPIGPTGAHQLWNTSSAPLRCLVFSTMREPDITVYPDSNKVGLYGGAAPGGPPGEFGLKTFLHADASMEYWEGE